MCSCQTECATLKEAIARSETDARLALATQQVKLEDSHKSASEILKVRSSITEMLERMERANTVLDSKRCALSSVSAEASRLERAVQTMSQTQDISVDAIHQRREAINAHRDRLRALKAAIHAVDESAAETFAGVRRTRSDITAIEASLSSSATRSTRDDAELRASLVQALQESLDEHQPR